MMQEKAATSAGTARYRDRSSAAAGHFRQSQGLWMSSIGLGSYLGNPDAATDAAYKEAVGRAAELGCNVFDSAANYRFQRSERSFGDAFAEAFDTMNQQVKGTRCTVLEAAQSLGITVMASASILQSRLSAGLPPLVAEVFPGLQTDAQRAIQFTRSTPGVVTSLIGMSNIRHVEENLALARIAPALFDSYGKLFASP